MLSGTKHEPFHYFSFTVRNCQINMANLPLWSLFGDCCRIHPPHTSYEIFWCFVSIILFAITYRLVGQSGKYLQNTMYAS